jgi:hypothetical protein
MVVRCVHADVAGFRLWPIFSAATLRRRLLEVLTCGGGGGCGGSCRGRTSCRSPKPRAQSMPRPRSDRLAELLRAEPSESGDDEGEADAAARKAAALEELKIVVSALQEIGDGDGAGGVSWRVEAATVVRRKAKDDALAREMLAMLGAIPPLVAMLDESNGGEELLAAALYALLNLGIGNDT